MTISQKLAALVIGILATIALFNGIKFTTIYFHLSEVVSPDSIKPLLIKKEDLAGLTREELENITVNVIEASNKTAIEAIKIPTTLFYTLISLVLSLKVSIYFNYIRAKKNT
jgi:hypothetical protein